MYFTVLSSRKGPPFVRLHILNVVNYKIDLSTFAFSNSRKFGFYKQWVWKYVDIILLLSIIVTTLRRVSRRSPGVEIV